MRIITPEFNLIKIGYQGENEAVCVQFDVSNWPELYGAGGTFALRHQRAGDPDGYPVIVTEEDGTVSWVVSNIDTRDPGYGKATLIYTVGDVVAMSVEYATLTEASVGENPEPPDPWKPWIDEILEARDEAVEAAEDAHEDANSASQSADDASTEALKAEGYAVGTQDGEAVGPDSPYYENNAKYFYEEIADEMGPIQSHLTDHNNPHQVTPSQIGAIEKVTGAVANDLAMLTADGNLADSGISADYLVPVKAASGSVIEFNSDGAVPLKSALLKGKTAAVNQLSKATARTHSSGVVFSVNADGFAVMNGTAASSDSTAALIGTGATTVNGHAYFVKGGTTSQIVKGRLGSSGTYVEMTDGLIFSGNGNNFGFITAIVQGTTYNNVVVPVNVIDLTLCGFTSEETADVATLKTAWLAKYGVPLPQLIPYNAGSIVSNNAVYQLTGRNIFDGGAFADDIASNASATKDSTNKTITYAATSVGPLPYKYTDIKFKPNTRYTFMLTGYGSYPRWNIAILYDDGTYTQFGSNSTTKITTVKASTSGKTVVGLRGLNQGGSTTLYYEECGIFEGDLDASWFEPYHDGGSITADSLNGIGTVADEQDKDGNITRRFGVVDLGTLTWDSANASGVTSSNGIASLVKAPPTNNDVANIICPKYITVARSAINTSATAIAINTTGDIIVIDSALASKAGADVKTAMNGVYLVYELATPTTDTTTPATLITQKGYNLLRAVSGDIQNAPADIEYLNGLAAVIAEALQ